MLAPYVGRLPWATGTVPPSVTAVWSRAAGEARAAASWLGRARCGVGGHVMVRHFEPGRISLQCLSCGEETPGWTLRATNA